MRSRIISPQNARVKNAVKLRDRRGRQEQGRIIIDGSREILRAIEGGVELVELFVCAEMCSSSAAGEAWRRAESAGASAALVTPAVFAKLSFGDRQEGLVAVAAAPQRSLRDLALPEDPLVAVLQGVEKPGNLGAVVRSADAAGVSAVIVAGGAIDLYNPNAIRSSLGAVFTLPVCVADEREALDWLRAAGSQIYAARVDAPRNYTDVSYAGRTAIVLGSESRGLSEIWRDESVTPVRLPMLGAVDSLNVSAAAAVLFYEALRQRAPR